MARVLTDDEVISLLGEIKLLPSNWTSRLRPRPKSNMAFSQRDLSVSGGSGHEFNLILRRSQQSPLDFSVILVYTEESHDYILRRNNGAHPSRHTNKWEKMRGVPDCQLDVGFHIHMATERYQRAGLDIDGYAEQTDRYQDFDGALRVMLLDSNFVIPDHPGSQIRLLEA